MNTQLQSIARQTIKDGLAQLPEGWQMRFKQMYAHGHLAMPINEVVDTMEDDKLDWAMQQVQNSVEKIKKALDFPTVPPILTTVTSNNNNLKSNNTMSNTAQSVTLQDAVLSQVKEFAANGTTFSVHDITTQIRAKVNAAQLEIPECEVPNSSIRFNISHPTVKGVFENLWRQGVFNPDFTLDRQFNGTYFQYSPVPVAAPVGTSVASPTPVASVPFAALYSASTGVVPSNAPATDRATIENRIQLYLNNCAARSFRPSLKQVQSAIKRGDVSTGWSCEDIKTVVEGLGFSVTTAPDLVSASQVVV